MVTLLSGIYESRSIEEIVLTAKRYASSFMQAKREAEVKQRELLKGLPDFDDVYPGMPGERTVETLPDADVEGVVKRLRRREDE